MAQYKPEKKTKVLVQTNAQGKVIAAKAAPKDKPVKKIAFNLNVKPKERSVGMAALAELFPLKSLMQNALAKEGVAVSKLEFPKLVEMFHNKFIADPNAPVNSLEGPVSPEEFSDNYLFKTPLSEYDSSDNLFGITIAGVANTVKKVTTFVKNVKQAKKNAKSNAKAVLTATQMQIAADAEKVEKELKAKAEAEAAAKKSDIKKYILWGVIGVVALILIYFLFVRKKH